MGEKRTLLPDGLRKSAAIGAVVVGLVGATVTGATTAFADQPNPSAQWAQFKNDPSRRGATTIAAPTSPGVAWVSGSGGAIVSGPVIAADGTVIVATNNGRIRAIKPDGADKWQREVGGANFFTQPFINQRGFVVFGAADGTIRAFVTFTSPRPDTGAVRVLLDSVGMAEQMIVVEGSSGYTR